MTRPPSHAPASGRPPVPRGSRDRGPDPARAAGRPSSRWCCRTPPRRTRGLHPRMGRQEPPGLGGEGLGDVPLDRHAGIEHQVARRRRRDPARPGRDRDRRGVRSSIPILSDQGGAVAVGAALQGAADPLGPGTGLGNVDRPARPRPPPGSPAPRPRATASGGRPAPEPSMTRSSRFRTMSWPMIDSPDRVLVSIQNDIVGPARSPGRPFVRRD